MVDRGTDATRSFVTDYSFRQINRWCGLFFCLPAAPEHTSPTLATGLWSLSAHPFRTRTGVRAHKMSGIRTVMMMEALAEPPQN
ncbi:unnamed protein product [Boreogadus saida]